MHRVTNLFPFNVIGSALIDTTGSLAYDIPAYVNNITSDRIIFFIKTYFIYI